MGEFQIDAVPSLSLVETWGSLQESRMGDMEITRVALSLANQPRPSKSRLALSQRYAGNSKNPEPQSIQEENVLNYSVFEVKIVTIRCQVIYCVANKRARTLASEPLLFVFLSRMSTLHCMPLIMENPNTVRLNQFENTEHI